MRHKYVAFRYIGGSNEDAFAGLDRSEYTLSVCKFRKDKILRFSIILFMLISLGRYRIYCVDDKKGLVHYSFVVPKSFKFRFLKKGDYHIGPCWTREDCRGKRIYGTVVKGIAKVLTEQANTSNVYVLIEDENQASIRGIKNTSFERVGICSKSKYLRVYSEITEGASA